MPVKCLLQQTVDYAPVRDTHRTSFPRINRSVLSTVYERLGMVKTNLVSRYIKFSLSASPGPEKIPYESFTLVVESRDIEFFALATTSIRVEV